MTSIEIPVSIAAALPSLSVMDITNDVSREVAAAEVTDGIAFLHAGSPHTIIRVQERETGFFEDLEALLERVVPSSQSRREKLLNGHETIGLTAGASTPEELVRGTAARLAEAGYALPEEIEVAKEDVHFRLPKEVAKA